MFTSLFGGPTKVYKVVEVEKPRALPAISSDEVKAMLATLPEHPGFQYILARLRTQKALLKQAHETTRYEKLEEVHMLQAGIFWAGWLEAELGRLTKKAAAVEADTTEFEADAFAQVDSMLERVGNVKGR